MNDIKINSVSTTFIEDIERMCEIHSVDIVDAVVTWCERNNVEIESVASLIKKDVSLKARLQAEAESARTVKRSGAQLPIF